MPPPPETARSSFISGAHVPCAHERTVVQLIEARADERPDARALSYGSTTLTYRQLDRRANELAWRLRDAGVRLGDLVPLVMARGPEVPLAMIAAMKLGAPFVPMDITWPTARLVDMVRAMAAKVVLCARGTPAALTGVVAVDAAGLPERGPAGLGPPAGLADLAYGFYTSGSTGTPKCALNVHRGLRNRFLYMNRRFPDRAGEVVLQASPHIFDPCLWQLLWPLTNGSVTVIPESSGLIDLATIIDVVQRQRVTITDMVPSVFNVLVEMIAAEPSVARALQSLRDLVIGGEEMQADAVQRFRRLVPHVRVTNTYGPTEAAIGMIFHEVRDEDTPTVPIGLPIDNTCAVITDENMRPVPQGVVGDLYIGGDCLGGGYLGDPEKTAAAFVANPFPQLRTAQLYRTGDLARLREDRLIGFHGRRDDQVKIAGLRVELGEVEAVLRTHPKVTDAKAVVHTEAEDRRLIAFVTGTADLRQGELLDHARALLPAYMVPARVMLLDAMPLLPNGKLDRTELGRRAADTSRPATVGGPLMATEQALAQIWARLLPVAAIARTDNFFELGGDSLSAQRMALAVRERLGTVITVRDVVRAPDLSGLAAHIAGEAPGRVTGPGPDLDLELPGDIRAHGTQGPGPAAHILLTGATGFVGSHVLHELLTQTQSTVHCLVRGPDIGSGRRRLVEALAASELIPGVPLERLRVIPGDLTRPRLGLDVQSYRILAETTECVVHCGAVVNLVLGYPFHRRANVAGTLEVLRLAVHRRPKHVHYISTLSVLSDCGGMGQPVPELLPAEFAPPADGYSLSKWVGERLVATAAERGVPAAIYRLGEVMPHSRIGRPSQRSLVDMLITACLQLGVAPQGRAALHYTPADLVGRTVSAAVQASAQGAFHLLPAAPMQLNDLLGGFCREFGLRTATYREFWALLDAAVRGSGDEAGTRLLAALPAAGPPAAGEPPDSALAELFQGATGGFGSTRAQALQAQAGGRWAVAGPEALDRYIAYHRRRQAAAAWPGRVQASTIAAGQAGAGPC